MNLFLDNIIFSLQGSGGISVYWAELISRLQFLGQDKLHFIERNVRRDNIFRAKLNLSQAQYLTNTLRPVFIDRYCPVRLPFEEGVFHSSYYRTLRHPRGIKQVVTVHDFTYERFSTGYKKQLHTWQKKAAIGAADVVICVSESTRRDLYHFYPEFSQKDIRVVYNGVSDDYSPLAGVSPNQEMPYLLFVGSRASYKNFGFAVDVVARLAKYKFVIIGSSLTLKEQKLLALKLPGKFKVYSNVSNSEMNGIYNNAFALIYPSSYEGFGIPVVEAMKAGCPVITLDNSSLPEISGAAGLLIPSLSVDAFVEGLDYIDSNRSVIIQAGLKQASNFSWDKCFVKTREIYTDVISD